MRLGLLPQVVTGYEQDASEKYPSGRGAHAYVEFAPKEQGNKEEQRCPPWASPQDARDSPICQVGGGLAPPAPNILYEEVHTYGSET